MLGTISLRFRFEVNFGVWYSIRVICSPPEYQLLALFFRARRFNFKILSLESFGLDAVKSNLTSLLSCDIFFGFYIIFITLRSLSMSQRSSRNCYSWSYDYIFNWVYFTDFIGFKAVKNNLFSLGGDCTAYYILSFHGGLNFVNFKWFLKIFFTVFRLKVDFILYLSDGHAGMVHSYIFKYDHNVSHLLFHSSFNIVIGSTFSRYYFIFGW